MWVGGSGDAPAYSSFPLLFSLKIDALRAQQVIRAFMRASFA